MTARGPKALAVLVAAACSSSALAIDDAQAAPCPGETTLEINDCLAQQLKAAQARLDKYFQAAIERHADDQPAVRLGIESSEKAFQAYRGIECSTVYEDWKEGTIRNAMALGCEIQLTDSRTHTIWSNWLRYMDSTPPVLPEPKPTP